MKIFQLNRSQVLPISIQEAWNFFSNPHNLSEITPPNLGLKIQSHCDGEIYSGTIIQYTVNPLGWPMNWISELKHVRPPYYFVDEQRSGPYSFWYHEHIFKDDGARRVHVMDRIYYALPVGPLSNVFNHFIVSRKLDFIFNYRKEVLVRKFGDQNAHQF